MSGYAFSSPHPLGAAPPPNAEIIKKMLLENEELIKTIYEFQKRGKVAECFPLQKVLHRNLVYLATLADGNVKIDSVMTSELSGVSGGGGGTMGCGVVGGARGTADVTLTSTTSVAMSTTTGPEPLHVDTPSATTAQISTLSQC